MPMFSIRTHWNRETNELTRLRREKARLSEPVLDLTETNPTRCGFDYGNLPALFLNPDIRIYEPDPHGLPSARKAVQEYYLRHGVRLAPEQIFLTSSTSEAYSYVLRLLANPGDLVLAPRPSYPLMDYLAGINDVVLRAYPLHYDATWQIDQNALARLLDAGARALVAIHPNNPTGSYLYGAERDLVVERCAEANAAVIADEVFLDFAYTGAPPASSFAGERRALTFTLSGLSKISALPQMKCAWIVVSGPAELQREAIERLEVIADTYLSLSTPVAHALPALLELSSRLQPQITERLAANLARLDSRISRGSPVERLAIEGGWSAVLRLPAIISDEEWAVRLLCDDGVLVHPGHFYEFVSGAYLVVSLLAPVATFASGIERLAVRVAHIAG